MTRPRSSLCVALGATALYAALGWSSPASADPAAAERLFVQAGAAYKRGDFLVAAEAFEAAFREEPAGAALYNAGLAWQSAREPGRAADAYTRALEIGGLDPPEQADAQQRLSALDRKLGVIDVRGDPGTKVTVAHARGREVPTRIHVGPGEHELRVTTADGKARSETVRVTAGQPTRVELGTAKAPASPTSPGAADAAAESENGPGALPIVGGVSLAAGGGLAVAAIVLGVKAVEARDEFDQSGQTDAELHDRAASLRTGANVCWVGAGVLAAAGVVMLIVYGASGPSETTEPPSAQASLRLTPTGALLDVKF